MDAFGIQWQGIVAFIEQIGRSVPGSRVIDRDGLVAAVVPGIPRASMPNSAVRRDHRQPPVDLAGLAEEYRAAGVEKWAVWIDGGDAASAEACSAHGMVLDSRPVAMIHDLAGLAEAPPREIPELATVGRVNDVAYGIPEPRLQLVAEHLGDALLAYGAGNGACVAMAYDHGHGDTVVLLVATLPEVRGKGLATLVMRRLLLDAKERGSTTATLQASAKGLHVYERVGFRAIGEVHLYEERFS
jgi:GNAT superfamily N-acetyltransferase